MKSKTTILQDDINEAISQIKIMTENRNLDVFEIYNKLFTRYKELETIDFIDYRFYDDHLKNISCKFSLAQDLTLVMLLNAWPEYLKDGFAFVVMDLIYLRNTINDGAK